MADKRQHIDKEDISEDAIVRLSSDIAPGLRIIIGIGQRVRDSILDYALGAAILGLIPVYGHWIPEIRLILALQEFPWLATRFGGCKEEKKFETIKRSN